jgi:hypothetical protein
MLMGTEREEGVDGNGRFCDRREELLEVMSSGEEVRFYFYFYYTFPYFLGAFCLPRRG